MTPHDVALVLLGVVLGLFLACVCLLLTWIVRGAGYQSTRPKRMRRGDSRPEPVIVEFDPDIEDLRRRHGHRAEE